MALQLGREATITTAGDPTTRTSGAVTTGRSRLAMALGALIALGLIVPFGVELFNVVVNPGRGPIYSWGDNAFIGIATKAAAGWQQLLGPYDRFGWHHPGPAYFYLQALPSHALASGQTLFFGATTINAVASLLSIAVVWRRCGYRAALWTGVCVTFLAIALGPALVRDPWNPYVVIIPMLLLAILCGGAATGSWLCLLGALLVGSYLVQTDLGTGPLVIVLLLVGLVVRLTLGRRRPVRARPMVLPRGLVIALGGLGAAALIAMWVPPVIQQVTGHPGNLTLLWRFFIAGHPSHSLGEALNAVGAIDARLGFRSLDVLAVAPGSHDIALIASLAVSVVAVGLALSRRHRFALGLGTVALVGQVVSIAAATRVVGPIANYLVLWEISLPVLAVVALGMAILGDDDGAPVRSGAGSPWTGVLARNGIVLGLVAGTVAALSLLTVRVVQIPPVSAFSAVTVGQAWELVRPQLTRTDSSTTVDIRSPASWPLAAGLADALDQHGVNPTVPPSWASVFGIDAATGRERAVVTLYERADAPLSPPVGSHYLGLAGNTLVFFTQRPAS
jgi:hypothetical protein